MQKRYTFSKLCKEMYIFFRFVILLLVASALIALPLSFCLLTERTHKVLQPVSSDLVLLRERCTTSLNLFGFPKYNILSCAKFFLCGELPFSLLSAIDYHSLCSPSQIKTRNMVLSPRLLAWHCILLLIFTWCSPYNSIPKSLVKKVLSKHSILNSLLPP